MDDLKKHSVTKEASYKKSGTISYQEFRVRYSKTIIDKIDEVLARHYGFTEDEKDFIMNFDARFRLQSRDVRSESPLTP